MPATISLPPHNNEYQWSINDFWSGILHNSSAVQGHTPIMMILAAFIDKNERDNFATTFNK
jgi:truncated hemoglobin YjbI